jgi:hypothetical protein
MKNLEYTYVNFPPMSPAEDAAFGTWAAELISKVLATGQFVPLRVKLMPKDLESVD